MEAGSTSCLCCLPTSPRPSSGSQLSQSVEQGRNAPCVCVEREREFLWVHLGDTVCVCVCVGAAKVSVNSVFMEPPFLWTRESERKTISVCERERECKRSERVTLGNL